MGITLRFGGGLRAHKKFGIVVEPPQRSVSSASKKIAVTTSTIPARGRSINPPHRAGSPTRDGVRGPPRQSLSHHAGHRQEPLPLFQRKAELCRRWKQDLPCNRGRYCRFAHGPHELGEPWILPPTKEQRSIETARQEGYASSRRFPIRSVSPPESRVPERRIRNRPFHETALCKTIICRYWRLDMKCPNGSRCAYAHGPRELREFVLPAMETTARWKDRSELDAPSEQGHREARTFLGRREPNRSLSPGETRVRDGQRRRLEEERIRKPPRSSSSPPLKTHSGPVPETARKRRRSIDLSWAQGLSKTARKRRNRRLSASSTGSGSSGLDEMDPRRRDRSLNPSVPPRIKRDESSDCEFEDDQHIVYSHVYPIAEDEDDAPGAEDNEDAYSPLYSPFSIIDTGSEPTPQSRARSVLSPFLETTRAPQSPLVPMPSTAPMPVLPSASPPAVTSVAPTPAPAPAPRPLSPVVVEDRLVPSDRDYFRTYFAELARRKKTVQPIF
ncbi:BQ2448_6749 [Microbotryum intermedium]|uniref:BQ2448_6749 protein n=1 Tax=Microbotryum intermedium TaxID=269621 RepID=A0A238FM16_9BASI|nr:BQ2448_6749 [Microbotryum intermedium]